MEPEFNWAVRLPQSIENSFDMFIPPDITFQFEHDEWEIEAHKWMMGLVSPVFNKMFFVADTKDKDAKKLLIKGTTFGAFNITKNAIYGIISMKNGLKGKSLLEVFSVLDLVTRYQISERRQIVRNHLASFPLTDDTVLEVATHAMVKTSTFEEEAKQLLILCAKFIKTKLKNTQAVFEYVADHEDDGEIVNKLLTLMKDIVCENCRQKPCQNGGNVGGQIREGLIVTSDDDDWWEDLGIVTADDTDIADVMNDSSVRVKIVNSQMWSTEIYRIQFCCQ